MSTGTVDNRFIEFKLGGQRYAIPLLAVKEVMQKTDITSVPNMPAYFEGMINLRGQILGVYNVQRRLTGKAKDSKIEQEVVIVIDQLGVSMGMIVDEVTSVLHAEGNSIGPAPLKESDPASAYIGAVIQSDNGLVQVLNLRELLELEKYRAKPAA